MTILLLFRPIVVTHYIRSTIFVLLTIELSIAKIYDVGMISSGANSCAEYFVASPCDYVLFNGDRMIRVFKIDAHQLQPNQKLRKYTPCVTIWEHLRK